MFLHIGLLSWHIIESVIMIETPLREGEGKGSKPVKRSLWKLYDLLAVFGKMQVPLVCMHRRLSFLTQFMP